MSETEKGIQNSRSSATDDGTPIKDATARENQEVEQQTHEDQPNGSIPVPIRTGFLSSLVIIPPIANTTHYSRRTKWMLTIVVALAALAAPLGSNILLRKWWTKILFSSPHTRYHVSNARKQRFLFPSRSTSTRRLQWSTCPWHYMRLLLASPHCGGRIWLKTMADAWSTC